MLLGSLFWVLIQIDLEFQFFSEFCSLLLIRMLVIFDVVLSKVILG